MSFPHTATVQRQTKSGTKYTYGDVGTTQCFLQPIDNEKTQIMGITFGKGFYCYVPLAADIEEHDRLVIDGVTYGLKGGKPHNYGSLAHKRLALEMV